MRGLYQFGPFTFDEDGRELRRDGQRVPLTPKDAELLLLLLGEADSVVEKSRIMKSVWPLTHVTEGSLTQSIHRLRQALGDTGSDPRYIESVPKRGYRFVAPVDKPEGREPPERVADDASANPVDGGGAERKLGRSHAAARLSLALLCLSAAGLAVWVYSSRRRSASTPPFQQMKVTKLTSFGAANGPAISPDGKYVAYGRGEGDGKFGVWLRVIGTTNEIQIVPPTEGVFYNTTFSPDGKYIAYGARYNDGPATYLVSVLGGVAKKIPLKQAPMVSFSPDGRRLAALYNKLPEGKTSVVIANADGSGEREVATRQAPNYYWTAIDPAWSPDGKLVACVGQNGTESFPHVFVVDVETGEERPITAQKWSNMAGNITWLPDMSGLLAVATEETSSIPQIWYIPYPSGEAHKITNDTVSYFGLSLTADGSALVTTKSELPYVISVMPVNGAPSTAGNNGVLTSGAGAKYIEASNFAGNGQYESFARLAWTPNGRIVYMSEESGNADIWSIDASGSDRRQLTTDPHYDTGPDVSPDGRHIAFMSNRAGAENIWLMDIDGGNQTRLTSKNVERNPVFSADSKWIYFTGWETGKAATWKIPVEGGEPVQVVADLSFYPAVSTDGSLLAYGSEGKIRVAPSAGGQPIKTFEERGWMYLWMPGRRMLSYLSSQNDVTNIWAQPLDGGEPQRLTDFKPGPALGMYAWSRDGKQLAVTIGSPTSDVVLLSATK